VKTTTSDKLPQVRGEGLRVLDLFAGCGGFSLGFKWAGYQLVGAVEQKPEAARNYARNLCLEPLQGLVHPHPLRQSPSSHHHGS